MSIAVYSCNGNCVSSNILQKKQGGTDICDSTPRQCYFRGNTSLKTPVWDCLLGNQSFMHQICSPHSSHPQPVSLSQQPVASVDTNPPVLSDTSLHPQHTFLACLSKNPCFLSKLQRTMLTYISTFIKFRFIRKHEMLL